jgi:hypothetical protein
MICQLAIGKIGYPGAEVARFLGVTTSSVNRLAVSQEGVHLTKYMNQRPLFTFLGDFVFVR